MVGPFYLADLPQSRSRSEFLQLGTEVQVEPLRLDTTTQATGQHCWDGFAEGFLRKPGPGDEVPFGKVHHIQRKLVHHLRGWGRGGLCDQG